MKFIGLTGGIGSGKSTVAKVFKVLQIPVFNSDDAAKSVVYLPHVKNQIINLLGEQSFEDNLYNKKHIASKVFANQELLLKLNLIIHPQVAIEFNKFCEKNSQAKYILKESAILFESKLHTVLNAVIAVVSPIELRIQRLQLRDNYTLQDIEMRMKSQFSNKEVSALANYIIYNDEKQSIISQVNQIHNQIITSHV